MTVNEPDGTNTDKAEQTGRRGFFSKLDPRRWGKEPTAFEAGNPNYDVVDRDEEVVGHGTEADERTEPIYEARESVDVAIKHPEVLGARDEFEASSGLHVPIRTIDGEPALDLDAVTASNPHLAGELNDLITALSTGNLNRRQMLQGTALGLLLGASKIFEPQGINESQKLEIKKAMTGLDILIWGALIGGFGLWIAGKLRKPDRPQFNEDAESVRGQIQTIRDELTNADLLGDEPYQINSTDITLALTDARLDALWTRFDNDEAHHDKIQDVSRWLDTFIDEDPDLSTKDSRERAKNAVVAELKEKGFILGRRDAVTPANGHKINPNDLAPNDADAAEVTRRLAAAVAAAPVGADPAAVQATVQNEVARDQFREVLEDISDHLKEMADDKAHANSKAFITAEKTRINALKPKIKRLINDLIAKRKALPRNMGIGDLIPQTTGGDLIDRRDALGELAKWAGGAVAGLSVLALLLTRGCSSGCSDNKPQGAGQATDPLDPNTSTTNTGDGKRREPRRSPKEEPEKKQPKERKPHKESEDTSEESTGRTQGYSEKELEELEALDRQNQREK